MEKRQLLTELNDVHRDLLTQVQDFSQADFAQAGVMGNWTAKDMFAHLAFWNWEAKRAIELALTGERPAPWLVGESEIEQANSREQQARRDVPLHNVMDDFRRSHKSVAALIERTPEQALAAEGPHRTAAGKATNALWVAQGLIAHYREHTQWLEEFVERRAEQKD
jgi:hypothetical protein